MNDSTVYSENSHRGFPGFEFVTGGGMAIVAIAAGGIPALVTVAALAVIILVGSAVKNYLDKAAAAREAAKEAAALATKEAEQVESAAFNQKSDKLNKELHTLLSRPQEGGFDQGNLIEAKRQEIYEHAATKRVFLESAESDTFNEKSIELYEELFDLLSQQHSVKSLGKSSGEELQTSINLAVQAIEEHKAKQPASVVENIRVGTARQNCERMAERIVKLSLSPKEEEYLHFQRLTAEMLKDGLPSEATPRW